MDLQGFLRFCDDYQVLQSNFSRHVSTKIVASLFDHQADLRGNINLAGFRRLVRKISEVFYENERNSANSYAILSSQQKFEMFCEHLQRFQVQSSPATRIHVNLPSFRKKVSDPFLRPNAFIRNNSNR